ncbi:MAG: NADH-quinone oxidoreductase subunit J [Actinomycetes bacterium]|nr:NADH-quinone oxidoreductase subunit J [Actinomycetes bacterium]
MLNLIAFSILAFATLAGALNCVTADNVVHAAYWLLACAVAAAGLVWFLGAEYIAVMQLLVYAGAVGILVVFTVMVTHRSYADAQRPLKVSVPSLAITAALFALLSFGILSSQQLASLTRPTTPMQLADFGAQLFSPTDGWTLAFEIASLVLTVALIAAVWWSRDTDGNADEDADEDGDGDD